jgi:fructokinase
MTERIRIGIDLGGTKIEGLALDQRGAEIARLRIATPQHDYAATVRAIAEVVLELERRVGGSENEAASVGVGIPGTVVHATGLVKNANSTWLNGQPLEHDLAAALARPVRCANDANCLAVSEATDGAAAGAGLVFAVILGTGCGGGIAVNGQVRVGPNGVSGEWGHNPLPWAASDDLRPRVLLRPARLPRDLDLRHRACARPRASDRQTAQRAGDRRRGGGRRRGG